MAKTIPKVEFSVPPLDEYFSVLHSFLNPKKGGWDWSKVIYRGYPQLKQKLKDVKDEKSRKKKEYQFFKEIFEKERPFLEKSAKHFQREWNKINDGIMLVLSKVVEQDWPEKDKRIFARVTINPMCPRYIKRRMFDLFYKQEPKYMESVAIHEILHFIYFEKWKDVFPEIKEEESDSPHMVWQLSEMVPGVVLNDKRIQKVFKYKFTSYKKYENFNLNGKPFLSYLQEFYNNKEDFEDFLKKSWEFVKKYEKEINSI